MKSLTRRPTEKSSYLDRGRMRRGNFITYLVISFSLAACACGQDLPRKIRGYSVYRANINVGQQGARENGAVPDAVVSLSDPTLKEISVAGATLEVSAEFTVAKQSGKVDFLAFHDLRVNGIPVEVDEYRKPFAFTKGETVKLPTPATIFVPTTQILRVAVSEVSGPEKIWTITGRVFIFGRFRKYGLEHKRVVPIDIDFKIANPLSPTSPPSGR